MSMRVACEPAHLSKSVTRENDDTAVLPGISEARAPCAGHSGDHSTSLVSSTEKKAGLTTQSTYTGVYAKGGPTNVDASGQLSDLLDRSPADVRGIKK